MSFVVRILVVLAVTVSLPDDLKAQQGFIIDSDGTNRLWSLNLQTGVATAIGPVNYPQIEGLATSLAGVVYGVDDVTDTLVTIDTTTGLATAVGSGDGNLGVDVGDVGLTFDGTGNLWMSSESGDSFYSVNPATGAATLLNGNTVPDVTGLAACGTSIYGLADGVPPRLVALDPSSGNVSVIGPLGGGIAANDDGGLAMGTSLVLWGIADDNGSGTTPLFTINRSTGAATLVANVTDGLNPISGVEGFTLASPPAASCSRKGAPALDLRALAALVSLLALVGVRGLRFLNR